MPGAELELGAHLGYLEKGAIRPASFDVSLSFIDSGEQVLRAIVNKYRAQLMDLLDTGQAWTIEERMLGTRFPGPTAAGSLEELLAAEESWYEGIQIAASFTGHFDPYRLLRAYLAAVAVFEACRHHAAGQDTEALASIAAPVRQGVWNAVEA